ncbi:MAG: HD domain-containing protein [Thermoprotei archaeon]|jgi:HD superfamily phosphohydrolase
MKVVRDPIHQNILLTDLDIKIIDTRPFQRLRKIKQTGMVYLVYPGAQHTRFEHSIGTRYVAEQILSTLKINGLEIAKDEEKSLYAAALLHDIGHTALSHSVGDIILGSEGHELVARQIIKHTEINDILKSEGLDPDKISDMIVGKVGFLSHIVRGEIDADRLDYLRRDAYYCGVAYGVIDTRIFTEYKVFNNTLTISRKGLRPAESVLFARYLMYNIVYNHKTVRIASTMISRAIEYALKNNVLRVEDLYKIGDEELMGILIKSEGEQKRLAQLVSERKLFKRAYYQDWDETSKDLIKMLLQARNNITLRNKLEEEIANVAGVNPQDVLIDIPELPILEEAEVKILTNNNIVDIKSLSPLSEALSSAYKRAWNFAIYTTKENKEIVAKASQKIFK